MDARFIPHSSITQGAALSVLPNTINDGWVCAEEYPFNSIFNTDLTVSPHLSESAPAVSTRAILLNIILHGNYMDARFIPHSSITQGAALSVLPDTINDPFNSIFNTDLTVSPHLSESAPAVSTRAILLSLLDLLTHVDFHFRC
jgi:hypothetical protein